jgi:hypothetical protein
MQHEQSPWMDIPQREDLRNMASAIRTTTGLAAGPAARSARKTIDWDYRGLYRKRMMRGGGVAASGRNSPATAAVFAIDLNSA